MTQQEIILELRRRLELSEKREREAWAILDSGSAPSPLSREQLRDLAYCVAPDDPDSLCSDCVHYRHCGDRPTREAAMSALAFDSALIRRNHLVHLEAVRQLRGIVDMLGDPPWVQNAADFLGDLDRSAAHA